MSGLILPEPPLRDAALTTIALAAQEQARRYRVSFLTFDYLSKQETKWPGWPKVFAATTIADPGTRLVINWPDFDGYLAHLPRSVRKDYRRHYKRAKELGIEIKLHPITETLLDETTIDNAMMLIQNVARRYGSPVRPKAREILEDAYMVDATWLTAEVEGRLVGCDLLVGDRSARNLVLLGRDYSVEYVFFQLFYAGIQRAIEEGVQVLRGGDKAYEFKSRLGFQPERNNYVVFVGNGKVLQRIGHLLSRKM